MNCKIMGILNLTDDSFFDGGQYTDKKTQKERVNKMITDGVDIIDIGSMSTKPGSYEISEAEELNKITNAMSWIRYEYPDVVLSIDTYRASVAEAAIKLGANMINDVSGGSFDDKMFDIVAKYNIPYIMMHTSAKPHEMQNKTEYGNLIEDIIHFFKLQISILDAKQFNNIIIDPGFGFGKTVEQNYHILTNLNRFKELGYPVLVGISRKSMIYRLLNVTPQEALNGTTAAHTIAMMQGADFLRVHDVREAVEVRTIIGLCKY